MICAFIGAYLAVSLVWYLQDDVEDAWLTGQAMSAARTIKSFARHSKLVRRFDDRIEFFDSIGRFVNATAAFDYELKQKAKERWPEAEKEM